MLGWTPVTGFADGLRKTVRYYRNLANLRRVDALTLH